MDETTIKGTVEKITYTNKSNGYSVAVVRVNNEKVTVTGTFPFLNEGVIATFNGEYTVHPTYGRQFCATSFQQSLPSTAAATYKYLSSGVIRGVGPATANLIVEKFGNDALDIIQNHPQELANIRGISIDKAMQISEEYKRQFGIKDLMVLLAPYNFSPERCVKIYKAFGEYCTEIIKDNPYSLCVSEIAVPFETAEQMAFDFGIDKGNELRIAAGIEYIIRSNLSNGHTCLPREKVLNVAVKLLETDYHYISDVCDRLIENLRVNTVKIGDADFLSLPTYHAAESYIAARLTNIKNNSGCSVPVGDLEIDAVENKLGIKFEDIQRDAIKRSFDCGILIITGGPGTGKTTTLNAIIELCERRNMHIQLSAPTGRAAKRMTELTGREAKTIHRLLEVDWTNEDKQKFARNERNPLECDVIIVDEASMLDSLLFESLLCALRLSCRIVLVGDVNQLPSISAGNILNDIISSGKFSTVALKKVFRQAKQSLIVTNAHAIIDNEPVDLSNSGKDFFFMNKNTAYDTANTVLDLVSERLPNAYSFDSVKNIQVICPSRKLPSGTNNLNNLLQACLNPDIGKNQFSYKGVYFREGDKVMQIKNNYDIEYTKDDGEKGFGVFNGDVGIIKSITKSTGALEIQFDDRTATYYYEELDQLELAYAVTVHKSQGSEFDCVVIPLSSVPSPLKFRNLLYTAVTRAKKLLVIVGEKQIFEQMIENDRKTLRYTMLQYFLKNYD